ncbi:Mitochondrial metalloendopeptidase OMA1 [Linum grandiflorum]
MKMMAIFRRFELALKALRFCTHKTPAFRDSASKIHLSNCFCSSDWNPAKYLSASHSYSSASHMLGLGRLRLDSHNIPFVSNGAKRFYKGTPTSTDNPRNWGWWYAFRRYILYIVYHSIYEIVPYTKRGHFAMWSHETKMEIGEAHFNEAKDEYAGRILSPTHPHGIRVRLIFNDIIEALKRSVRDDDNDQDEAELDAGKKAKRHYVHKFEWEVMLVDNPEVNACCIPTGKIVVFTGFLDYFETDAEIATILGHEVGHVVA